MIYKITCNWHLYSPTLINKLSTSRQLSFTYCICKVGMFLYCISCPVLLRASLNAFTRMVENHLYILDPLQLFDYKQCNLASPLITGWGTQQLPLSTHLNASTFNHQGDILDKKKINISTIFPSTLNLEKIEHPSEKKNNRYYEKLPLLAMRNVL